MLETLARQAETELERASDELENLRNRHHTAALAVASHEKDLERSRERVKALGEAQEARGAERSQHLAEFESLAGERDRLEALLSAAREERLQRQHALDALGLRLAGAARERSRLDAAATERRVHQASRGESCQRARTGLERVRAQNLETREWVRRREAEIQTSEARREELARTLAEAELALAARLREEEAARLASEEKRDAWETLAAQVREQETAAREVRIELEAGRDEARGAELALRELELRRGHLEAGVRERWSVDLATWKPPVFALDPLEPGADGNVEIAAFDGRDEETAAGRGRRGRAGRGRRGARRAARGARDRGAAGAGSRGAPGAARRSAPAPRGARRREPRRDRGARGAARALPLPRGAAGGPRQQPGPATRGDRQDQPHQPQALPRDLRRGERALPEELPAPVPRREGLAHADRDGGRARGRHRDHGPAARQAAPEREPALGRREDDDGDRAARVASSRCGRRPSSCSTRWTPRSTTPTSAASTRSCGRCRPSRSSC